MSSTNRSKARESHVADYYVTPLKDAELFLNEFNKRIDFDWNTSKIIDPCAGGNPEIKDENGRIIDIAHPMSYPTAISDVFGDCSIDTYDIREDSLANHKQDYLTTKLDYEPDMIITNPPFNCFSLDTEIKTRNGWKKYTELSKEDEVLSCNIDTLELEWSKINCFIEKDLKNEEVINFKHRFLDMIVTKEQRMFSYSGLKNKPERKNGDVYLAKDINTHSCIPLNGYSFLGNDCDYFILNGTYVSDGQKEVWHPEIKINLKDWARFLGVWLADGYCRHTLNSKNNQRYTCGIKQHKRTEKELLEILDKLPFDYKIYKDISKDEANYEIHSKQLWEYMIQFGYSKDKFIPNYVKDSNKEILETFLDSYAFGDSTRISEDTLVFQSVSKRLMEDVQEILLKLGYFRHVQIKKTKYKEEDYIIYYIRWNKNRKTQNNLFYSSKKEYKKVISYSGKVFCLNLEKNGFFLLRRNGHEFFSGNCATSIIEKALSDVKEGGYVIMLLRLNFFGSKERKPFFDKYMPEWCFVHHIRIGFLDKKDEDGYVIIDKNTGLPKRGSTDSIEYCHMVFKKGVKPEFTKLVVI